MLLHTGRSGLRASDLCLFNTDLSEVLSRSQLAKDHTVRLF